MLNILSQDMENIKKTQTACVQMKTTISEKKNTPDGIDDRPDTEDKVSEQEDAAVETTYNETIKREVNGTWVSCGTAATCVIRGPKRGERERKTEENI